MNPLRHAHMQSMLWLPLGLALLPGTRETRS